MQQRTQKQKDANRIDMRLAAMLGTDFGWEFENYIKCARAEAQKHMHQADLTAIAF